jgi:DUF177 domain-containing protein
MQGFVVETFSIPPEGLCRGFVTTGAELGIAPTELAVVPPVQLECHFSRVNDEVVVQGRLRSALRMTCSRCAEDFEEPICVTLDAMYLPTLEVTSARTKELEDGEVDVYPYTDQVIEITQMVRDKLLLSMPLQPLCTNGCKGLCPSCGVNRNVVSCQCGEERLGSPFEALKEFRICGRGEE